MTKEIENEFVEAVLNDYHTAAIKSEVLLDTLITPAIEEILSLALDNKGIRYITKEFPIFKDTEVDWRSCKADYLLSDEKHIYLVELKTTNSSYRDSQYANYKNIRGENFKKLGDSFLSLLYKEYKPDDDKTDFKDKLNRFITTELGDEVSDDMDISFLRSWMKRHRISGTKKYIMQAFQMWKAGLSADKTIEIVYIVPEKKNITELKQVSFQEIIELYDRAGSEYLKWLIINVLTPLFKKGSDQ